MKRRVLYFLGAGLFALPAVGCEDTSQPQQDQPSAATLPEPKAAEYRGYGAINEAVRARLVAEPDAFELSSYLGPSGAELARLVGSWGGVGIQNEFQNGAPNVLNFVVWRLMFSGLGRDVAALCPGAPTPPSVAGFQVHPQMAPAVEALCSWPDAKARDEETLQAFWLSLAAYDAPVAEYEAWRDHFRGETYRNKGAGFVIPLMVTTAMLNPHVLLQK